MALSEPKAPVSPLSRKDLVILPDMSAEQRAEIRAKRQAAEKEHVQAMKLYRAERVEWLRENAPEQLAAEQSEQDDLKKWLTSVRL